MLPNKFRPATVTLEARPGSTRRRKVFTDSTLFGSWQEYLDEQTRYGIAWKDHATTLRGTMANGEFDSTGKAYAETLALATNGWPEGRARMEHIARDTAPYALRPQQRPQWEREIAGAIPCMPSFIAGAPEHMLNRNIVNDYSRSVVRIVSSSAANGNVHSGAMMHRGAAILSLVDYLEASGTRVELTIYDGAVAYEAGETYRFETLIVFKRPEEALDMDRLAFALVHPNLLRHLQFRLQEQCADTAKFGGYGGSTDYKPEADEVYLPTMYGDYGYETPHAAMQSVIAIATDALGAAQFKQG